jgi:DNA-binding NarL/FixJ family response regulator
VNDAAPVRAFLIASVRAYREPFARALRSAGTDVVGTAPDPLSALPLIGELEPEAILVDAVTPDQRLSIAGLRAVVPETPIVALGIPDRPVDAVALVEAGASGYVTRDQSVDEAASVVSSVVHGEFPCSGRVARILADRVSQLPTPARPLEPATSRLTAREHEIAELVGSGMSNKEIANVLSIELATVKNHVHNVLGKLGVTRRSEVASRVRSSR